MGEPTVIKGANCQPVIEDKPWGHEVLLGATPKVAMKQLSIQPFQCTSRQVHVYRDELYFVTDGYGRLELGANGDTVHILSRGDVAHIPPGTVHRVYAGAEGICITEASTQELTDVIRLEDRYGRPTQSYPSPSPLEPSPTAYSEWYPALPV